MLYMIENTSRKYRTTCVTPDLGKNKLDIKNLHSRKEWKILSRFRKIVVEPGNPSEQTSMSFDSTQTKHRT